MEAYSIKITWDMVWIAFAIIYAVDAWLFSKGYDTIFHGHKTDEEKRILEAQVRMMELEVIEKEQELNIPKIAKAEQND